MTNMNYELWIVLGKCGVLPLLAAPASCQAPALPYTVQVQALQAQGAGHAWSMEFIIIMKHEATQAN